MVLNVCQIGGACGTYRWSGEKHSTHETSLDTPNFLLYTSRMNISELFDQALLREMLDGGYVSTQVNPNGDLMIMNYSPAAQYGQVWNDVTTQCRGLIVEWDTGDIVARPFGKFFNYAEAIEGAVAIPEGDPIVTEKMDGSLGIIYTHNGKTAVATRGSFTSDQALWATEFLNKNFPDFAQPEGVTTLVEIIYPENRIVVDYNGAEGLWFLGAIDNETGADIDRSDIHWWYGPATPDLGTQSVDSTVAMAMGDSFANDEGVVLCWPREGAPSFRLKVKNPRYVELHRIVTGLSTRTIWEALATDTFDQILEAAPDEFHPWIRNVEADLRDRFEIIYSIAEQNLLDARRDALAIATSRAFSDGGTAVWEHTRRDLAEALTKSAAYPGLCFALEDGKDIAPRIWQMIKPERSLAMIVDIDE
jgi:RNA ligase